MPKLYDVATDRVLGDVPQADLDLLIARFEEESSDDRDYYVNRDTLQMLADAGASSALLGAIEAAFDDNGEADIRWTAD